MKPNLPVILADNLRPAEFGVGGPPCMKTPCTGIVIGHDLAGERLGRNLRTLVTESLGL